MTEKFVTLPREAVEQAIAALTDLAGWRAAPLCDLLRAALEQPDHSEQSYMEGVTAGRNELASEYPLPTDLYDSKDWRCGTYAERVEWLHTMYEDAKEQIAALEQPQNHVPDVGSMVPDGWKLVPVEPTQEMLDQLRFGWSDISTAQIIDRWKRTVDAAPQPPTTSNNLHFNKLLIRGFTSDTI